MNMSLFKNQAHAAKVACKKGQLGNATGIVIGLFVITVLVFAVALAGASMKTATNDTTAQNVITQLLAGVNSYANLSTAIWVIAAVGVLLAILFASIAFARR